MTIVGISSLANLVLRHGLNWGGCGRVFDATALVTPGLRGLSPSHPIPILSRDTALRKSVFHITSRTPTTHRSIYQFRVCD